jgi:hypothetical protein
MLWIIPNEGLSLSQSLSLTHKPEPFNRTLFEMNILGISGHVTSSRIGVRRESVLFIGTQFSNLYTAVDTPAEAAWLCVCVCV